MKKIVISAALLGATFIVQATLITTSGDPVAETAVFSFSQNVSFEIITAVTSDQNIMFVIDEAVSVVDGEKSIMDFTGLEYSINSGTPIALDIWLDNNVIYGDITARDQSFFSNTDTTLSIGDIVTLYAGDTIQDGAVFDGLTGMPPSPFNMASTGNYSMFIAGPDGVAITGVVPEPATAGMLALSGLLIAAYRRLFGRA